MFFFFFFFLQFHSHIDWILIGFFLKEGNLITDKLVPSTIDRKCNNKFRYKTGLVIIKAVETPRHHRISSVERIFTSSLLNPYMKVMIAFK